MLSVGSRTLKVLGYLIGLTAVECMDAHDRSYAITVGKYVMYLVIKVFYKGTLPTYYIHDFVAKLIKWVTWVIASQWVSQKVRGFQVYHVGDGNGHMRESTGTIVEWNW